MIYKGVLNKNSDNRWYITYSKPKRILTAGKGVKGNFVTLRDKVSILVKTGDYDLDLVEGKTVEFQIVQIGTGVGDWKKGEAELIRDWGTKEI